MFEFECPACNHQSRVNKSMAGKEFTCSQCNALLELPTLAEMGYQDSGAYGEDNSSNQTIAVNPDSIQDDPNDRHDNQTIAVSQDQLQSGPNPTIAIGSPIDEDHKRTIAISKDQLGSDKTIQIGGAVGSPVGRSRSSLDNIGEDTIEVKPGSQGQAAFCASHPGRSARKICGRCGNFMCMDCSGNGRRQTCPECRDRSSGHSRSFPFNKETWTAGSVIDWSWQTFQRDWVLICVGALLVGGIGQIIGMFGQGLIGGLSTTGNEAVMSIVLVCFMAFAQIFQGVLQMGIYKMCFEVARGAKPELGMIFSQFSKFMTYTATILISGFVGIIAVGVVGGLIGVICVAAAEVSQDVAAVVGLGLGTIATIVLGVYLLVPMMFLPIELTYNDDAGPVEALQNTFTIVSEQHWSFFGTMMLFFLIGSSGFLLCCVGLLFTAPLMQFMFVVLFMALRNGSGLPPVTRRD